MRTEEDYLQKPIRSLQTMLRVISAAEGTIPSVVPDGIYGEDTQAAVAAFQLANGLPVTGMTDERTWNSVADVYCRQSPCVLPAAPLRIVLQPHQRIVRAERNRHVYLIQAMLCALRETFSEIPQTEVNGVHGEGSVEAIRWLQRKAGLPEDGEIDQTVWQYLVGLYTLTEEDGCCGKEENLLE